MKKNIYVFAAFSFLVLNSCYTGKPIQKGPAANNSTYEVEYLFEHDGCKVYRFYDQGNFVYFTNCEGTVSSFKNDTTKNSVVNQVRLNDSGN